MSVYDEKSDFDNPFVEPLFDLNIYKAKMREVNDDLIVKTKIMKFALRCDQVYSFKYFESLLIKQIQTIFITITKKTTSLIRFRDPSHSTFQILLTKSELGAQSEIEISPLKI